MRRVLVILLLGASLGAAAAGGGLSAQPVATASTQVDAFLSAIRLDETLETMRREGLDYGMSIEEDLFPGAGGARWQDMLTRIYDPAAMRARFEPLFRRTVDGFPDGELAAAVEFFTSPLGRRVVELENAARAAQLDEAVEDASRARVEQMQAEDDPRIRLIGRFVEVNDLIEANVVGALNANIAFYQGLNQGRAFGPALAEDEILRDVASQEASVREETGDWVFAYLALAYQSLTDEELERYTAFSATEAGRALNRALFSAYDGLFEAISRDLGRGAARFIAGQEL